MSTPHPLNRAPNVYRDGKLIVAPIENAVFPNRCVKTNAPVAAADHQIDFDVMVRKRGESAPHTDIGMAVRAIKNRKKVTCHIGLCDEKKKRSNFLKKTGIIMVILGPILAVVLAVLTGPGGNSSEVGVLGFVMMGIGFSIMIAGIILFAISTGAVLMVKDTFEHRIKLSGACEEYLDELPIRGTENSFE